MARMSVDLPQPLGPRAATCSPARMVRSMSWRTTRSPRATLTWRSVRNSVPSLSAGQASPEKLSLNKLSTGSTLSDYSSFGIGVVRNRALKWLFPQEKATLHSAQKVYLHSESALKREGAHTWDVQGRGRNSTVITDLGDPWGESDTCTGCGKCVQVCPTGALFLKGKTRSEEHTSELQ